MAVVKAVGDGERSNQTRYPVVDTSEIMEIRGEDVGDKVYVVAGKNRKESQLTLLWALRNSAGGRICILHVHQPADKIPISNVCVELHYIEMDSIEKGIVEFILQHNVKRLVMGGAADKHYSKRMVDLRSKKAIYVRLLAAPSCQIRFICKGNIIFTRPGRFDGAGVSISSPSPLRNTNIDSVESSLRSRSVIEGLNTTLQLSSPTQDYRRVMSDSRGTRTSSTSGVEFTPPTRLSSGRAVDVWGGITREAIAFGVSALHLMCSMPFL